MKTNNTKQILRNFYLPTGEPLDSKFIVNSLSTLNDEIPQFHRYLGMIFFCLEDKKHYFFDENLIIPKPLINTNNIKSITVHEYNKIESNLENYKINGNMIWIFPLNVLYYYDGNNWTYLSGTYNIRLRDDINNLSTNLIQKGAPVNYNNELYLWGDNKKIIPKFTITNTTENLNLFNDSSNYINTQYFEHKKQLFQVINGNLYKVGSRVIQLSNFNLQKGYNKLYEFLFTEIGTNNKPPVVKAIIWVNKNINSQDNEIYLNQIELDIFYKQTTIGYELYCETDVLLSGDIELIF